MTRVPQLYCHILDCCCVHLTVTRWHSPGGPSPHVITKVLWEEEETMIESLREKTLEVRGMSFPLVSLYFHSIIFLSFSSGVKDWEKGKENEPFRVQN